MEYTLKQQQTGYKETDLRGDDLILLEFVEPESMEAWATVSISGQAYLAQDVGSLVIGTAIDFEPVHVKQMKLNAFRPWDTVESRRFVQALKDKARAEDPDAIGWENLDGDLHSFDCDGCAMTTDVEGDPVCCVSERQFIESLREFVQ